MQFEFKNGWGGVGIECTIVAARVQACFRVYQRVIWVCGVDLSGLGGM
jgi:hypothetical protein